MAGNAQAAQELATIAAGDNRTGLLLSLFLPALGWVGFNILGPAKNQLDTMAKKSFATGLGIGAASLLLAAQANASTEVMELAAGDNRTGIILALFLPVVGWVGFNILQPALNQLDSMKKGLAGGVGLGAASLLAAQSADAAEVMQLAAGDNRTGIILALFLPVVGWVGFNILQPALNQLDSMKKGVAGGVGLGAASLLMAQQADAATEVMELAAGDNRSFIILALFLPVVGWVGFNILQPALNQLDDMSKKDVKDVKKGGKKR